MHDQFQLKNLVFGVDEVLWTDCLRLYMYLWDFRLSESAFEYSGQKCSACSRLYVPKSKWPVVSFICGVKKSRCSDSKEN